MTRAMHPAVAALAEKARAAHHGALAVLGYGSALRDSSPADTLVDLYVLTESFSGVNSSVLARLGCRLAPPNVHYLEAEHEGNVFRAKYAVLPLLQFASRCGSSTANPYFWARFCQPAQLIWARDEQAAEAVQHALQAATATAYAHAKALAPDAPATAQWQALFRETYRTEFRPEGAARATDIVAAHAQHYEAAAIRHAHVPPAHASWAVRRATGKLLTVLRLAKASFTFRGGPDYLAWKIKRHSGVEVTLTDFQRRHPLLASVTLLPRLLRKGAVK